jgi:hypothetical protein
MFEKLIAVGFNVPEEYKELEDEFMDAVLACLMDKDTHYIYLPRCKGRKFYNVEQLISGKYEFVDQIKGF